MRQLQPTALNTESINDYHKLDNHFRCTLLYGFIHKFCVIILRHQMFIFKLKTERVFELDKKKSGQFCMVKHKLITNDFYLNSIHFQQNNNTQKQLKNKYIDERIYGNSYYIWNCFVLHFCGKTRKNCHFCISIMQRYWELFLWKINACFAEDAFQPYKKTISYSMPDFICYIQGIFSFYP